MSHLRKTDDQAYTNEAAIEKRILDNQDDRDQLSQSHSQSEDETQ